MKKMIKIAGQIALGALLITIIIGGQKALAATGVGAAYGFAEGSGTTALDSSGNGNTASLQGVTWVTGGKFDDALSFNGIANYVQIPNSASLNITGNQATISFWINPTATPGHDQVVLGKLWVNGSFNSPYYQYGVEINTGNKAIDFYFADSSGRLHGPISSPVNSIQFGVGQNVAITYDGSNARFYINGVLTNTVAQTGSFVSRTTNVRFGVDGTGNQAFKGKLDEVRIYPRALSQAEIQADIQTAVIGGGNPPPGDTIAPTVSISSPLSGAVASSTLSLAANASDNVGVAGVQFLLDGVALGTEDTVSPYSLSWNTTTAAAGSHTISATARDAAGNKTTSSGVSVIVDNNPPTGSVVINGGATATKSTNVTLTLSATGNQGSVTQMRFSNTGSSYSAAEAYATTKAWTLATGTGTKTVYVEFKDSTGNWSSAITSSIVVDTTAPTISAVAASSITANSAVITWTTNEPATSQVEYGLTTSYGALTAVNSSLVTSHSVTVTGLTPQTHYNFRARSTDAAGNETLGTNGTFTTLAGVDNTAPTVSITNPLNGATLVGSTAVSIAASDAGSGLAGIQFKIDGTNYGNEFSGSPYQFTLDTTTLANGTHSFAAVARDAAGNTTTSTISVTVNNQSDGSTYSTSFPLTENPISEGGTWINGKAVGIDWNNVQTTPGEAYASVLSGDPNRYNDSVAELNTAFSADQYAQGTVYREAGYAPSGSKHEIELLLRFQITPNNARGYEVLWGASGYLAVVRWNGPLGNYTPLYDSGDPGIGAAVDGDVLRAEISGNTIKVYKNGTLVETVSDATYANGQPGMGLWPVDDAIIDKYGWRSYTAGSLNRGSGGGTTDTTSPTVPTNLTATPVSTTQITLSWTSSTDNVGVTGYKIYRNGAQIATSGTAAYSDNGLAAGTSYTYAVAAYDAAGNTSAQSSQVSATTQTAGGGGTTSSLTFGNTVFNAGDGNNSPDQFECGVFTAPATGTLGSLSQLQGVTGATWKGILVNAGTKTIVTNGIGNSTPTANGWATSTFAISPSVTAGTNYALCFTYNTVVGGWKYLDSGNGKDLYDSSNSFSSPTNPTDGQFVDYTPTVYATYTTTQ